MIFWQKLVKLEVKFGKLLAAMAQPFPERFVLAL
jgi:hypothetical protein